ncbi:peptidoglycan binding domain-containing protein [Kitasatospora sp. NPDC127111]|uniref:peptidoglycan binding domain-containing protein n=1 Tax=Kitasatospora sp. NPDC127111 TaxID=3345363 RepID=UPI0036403C13
MSSRESENAHPTPRRTGPDAYPSGTPPYGTPEFPGGDRAGAGAAQGSAAGDEDETPKTETTLTTRVRINIPGSRPIPPVVVRSTVKNEDGPGEEKPPAAAEPGAPRHRSAAAASPVLGVMEGGARTATPPNLPPEWEIPPATSESESTGAWFRPRQKKAPAAEPAPAPVPAGAPGAPAAAAPAAGAEARPNGARPNGARPQGSGRPQGPGTARPDARPVPAQGGASAPRPTGAPASPFGPGPDAPADEAGVYEDGPAGPPSSPAFGQEGSVAPGGPLPRRERQGGGRPQSQGSGRPAGGAPGRPGAPMASVAPDAANPEDTSVDGFEPIRQDTPPPAAISGLPQNGGPRNGAPQANGAPQNGRPQPGLFASAPAGTDPFAAQRPPAGTDPFGTDPFGTAAPGGLFPGAPGRQGEPGSPADPFNGPPVRPDGETTAAVPAPAPAPQPAEPAKPAAPKTETAKPRKGGSGKKLVKLGVYGVGGVLFLGAAAYGTGLMLNQSDVPKGTVVLGTDIGGSNRDQAIHQLDESVGKAGQQPLKLKIGDQTLDLDPAVAGLSFDTTATVDKLTQHSYNPVDVISSLKGDEKAVPPEVKVDRAKLKAALDGLATGSGQGLTEGYVKFGENGEPVVVPGKAGQAVDSASAVDQVEQAYRDRAAGKTEQPVALTVTAAQPKVSTQALQAAADSLGKSVVNGKIHLVAGAKTFDFGPKTAARTITLVPDASGKIVPKWDLDALNGQLNGVFDKVKVKKKDGQTGVITPQDAADAIASVFDKTGDKDRTVKFTTV